ncbi:MAG TPA: NAD-dependent epimerase/dehydratase family protein [Fulvivirga sp.]|nr:NAD-dependent epimerase/dehydratase family protein [Fulvivirga sp.]
MILVTGANGLLGSFTCKALLKEGFDVLALVRSDSDLSLINGLLDKLQIVEGDILDPECLYESLKNVTAIVHCAAVVSFHQSDKELMNTVNIQGTANMVNLALKLNIEYFLQISSVAAIGRLTGNGEVDENSKWQYSKWNSNYAQSKHFAELEVWRGMEEGLNAAILNPSVILAPGDWKRSSGALFKYVWDENLFYPDGKINYVDVRDVVQAIISCLKMKPTKERFIVNGGITSYKQLFNAIAKAFDKKPPKIKSNPILLKIGMLLDKIRSLITGRRTIITTETALLTQSEIYFSNAKIKKELNLTFVPFTETIGWNCEEFLKL